MNELALYNHFTDIYLHAAKMMDALLWDYVTERVDYEEIAKWEAVRDRANELCKQISSNPDFIPF